MQIKASLLVAFLFLFFTQKAQTQGNKTASYNDRVANSQIKIEAERFKLAQKLEMQLKDPFSFLLKSRSHFNGDEWYIPASASWQDNLVVYLFKPRGFPFLLRIKLNVNSIFQSSSDEEIKTIEDPLLLSLLDITVNRINFNCIQSEQQILVTNKNRKDIQDIILAYRFQKCMTIRNRKVFMKRKYVDVECLAFNKNILKLQKAARIYMRTPSGSKEQVWKQVKEFADKTNISFRYNDRYQNAKKQLKLLRQLEGETK